MSGASDRAPMSAEEEERLEREHWDEVIDSFLFYREHALARLQRSIDSFERLPHHHQEMMPRFRQRTLAYQAAVETNSELVVQFAQSAPFGDQEQPRTEPLRRPREHNMEKVYTTIKQLYRDWAAEGAPERAACFTPILDVLQELYPPATRSKTRVCVPGCGLARLPFEIARLGFECQGNEWSVHMLLAAHVMLNSRRGTLHTTVHPWAHIFTNNYAAEAQLQGVMIPDTDPFDMPPAARFSMAAGDFLEVYREPDAWHSVVTCFFIDTARNVIAYVEHIYAMLRPGGYWINFGPLLYHFDDNRDGPSIELSYAELRHVIQRVGFEFLTERFPCPSPYISDPASMMQMTYNCVFFVARKPQAPAPAPTVLISHFVAPTSPPMPASANSL